MSGWLLDTNLVSAFAPGKPPLTPEQAEWFERRTDELYLSAITAAEIEAGIRKLGRSGAQRRADDLSQWFERVLDLYGERVLPFDLVAARACGALSDTARALGQHPGFADLAIAAIAETRGLTVLTLNLRHFAPLGVAAADPFGKG